MSKQAFVANAPGPRFVGDVFPAAAENGDSFLYTASSPKSLHVWDGNPGAGHWIFWGYLRDLADADVGTAGYAALGGTGGGSPYSTIEKLTFSTESISAVVSTSSAREQSNGCSSMSNGYMMGGFSGTGVTRCDRLTFSTDNTGQLVSGLGYGVAEGASFESSLAGYLCGGLKTSDVDVTSAISKLTFAGEGIVTLVSNIGSSRYINGGCSSSLAGYAVGGRTYGTHIDKLTFSTDACVVTVSTLSPARGHTAGYASAINGYTAGGHNNDIGVWYNIITRISFNNDSTAILSTTLSRSPWDSTGFESLASGYAAGGGNGSYTNSTSIDRLLFSIETNSLIISGLATSRSVLAGFENLN